MVAVDVSFNVVGDVDDGVDIDAVAAGIDDVVDNGFVVDGIAVDVDVVVVVGAGVGIDVDVDADVRC